MCTTSRATCKTVPLQTQRRHAQVLLQLSAHTCLSAMAFTSGTVGSQAHCRASIAYIPGSVSRSCMQEACSTRGVGSTLENVAISCSSVHVIWGQQGRALTERNMWVQGAQNKALLASGISFDGLPTLPTLPTLASKPSWSQPTGPRAGACQLCGVCAASRLVSGQTGPAEPAAAHRMSVLWWELCLTPQTRTPEIQPNPSLHVLLLTDAPCDPGWVLQATRRC